MKIKTNQSKELIFETQIRGITKDKLEGEFKVKIDNVNYGFSVEIKEKEIIAKIPPLEEIIKRDLKDGEKVDTTLDIIGDGFHIGRWTGNLQIEKPVEFTMKIKEEKIIEEEKPILKLELSEKKTKKINNSRIGKFLGK